MICGSGGSKSGLAKAAGAEPSGQMRDEKFARRCGAKHISKSKRAKHTRLGALLEVEMSKKCTPLWREAHSDHFWTFRCRFAWQAQGIVHCVKSEQNMKAS